MAGIQSDWLRAAKDLISKPEAWTQHTNARDAQGKKIASRNPAAVCFCGFGALIRVEPEKTVRRDQTYFYLNRMVPGCLDYVEWQDAPERTHDEVMNVFSRAIAQAEAEGM